MWNRAAYGDVYIGGHNLKNPTEAGKIVMPVTNFTTHPNYRKTGVRDDIALIELPQEVTFTGVLFGF